MTLRDSLFGSVEITEPVLVELIASRPLVRLQGIQSSGACQYIHEGRSGSTRFDHSVGVMLIVRHFGAPLEEQIAGLLHDVSHTAFSHVGDYVFGDAHGQGHQDRILADFIRATEIPAILERHGFSADRVADTKLFPLVEQEIPDLCADRVDYSLRHPLLPKHLAPLTPQAILQHIVLHRGRMVMDDPAIAIAYARAFSRWYQEELSSLRCVAAFQMLAESIKRAVAIGALTQEDLFQDDAFVDAKLRGSSDRVIQKYFRSLTPEFQCVLDATAPDFTSGQKNRYIDPLVLVDGALVRASSRSPALAADLAKQKERLDGVQFPIRILRPAR